jgi:hypothetical protein
VSAALVAVLARASVGNGSNGRQNKGGAAANAAAIPARPPAVTPRIAAEPEQRRRTDAPNLSFQQTAFGRR